MQKPTELPHVPKEVAPKARREVKAGLPPPIKADLPAPKDESKPLTQVDRASQQLLKILDETPNNPGERELEQVAARADIAHTFEQFPTVVPRFTDLLRAELSTRGFDPGTISVFIGGGRLVGKPLKADSDIDLFITFEHPLDPYNNTDAVIDGQEWRALRKKLLFEDFVSVCEEVGIPNVNGYPGRLQFMTWGERSPEEFLKTQQEGEKALLLHADGPGETEEEIEVVLDELPFTYERVDDPELADVVEHRKSRIRIAGKEPKAATDAEILARIKRDKEGEQWYTSEGWRLKGKPAEQVDIQVGEHAISIYNYNGEAPLTDVQLEMMRTTLSEYLGRFPQLADHLKWICIEDQQEASIHGDEDLYPLNGLAVTKWGLFHLTPRGMEVDLPHRIAATNNLQGTFTHELTHFIQEEFRDDWADTGAWTWCFDDLENWEIRKYPDGRSGWVHKTTGETAPSGKFPQKPEEFVTHYAKIDPDEDLCESMVAYMYDPARLRSISPTKYDVIARHDQKGAPVEALVTRVPSERVGIPKPPATTVKYYIDENG